MTRNVGGIDRGLRVAVGLTLLSLLVLLDGGARWLGLIGLLPLISGLSGTCFAYSMLGISTCPAKLGRS